MKKLSCLLIVMLLCCSMVLPAAADILWEPYNNDYYMSKSYDTFTNVGRTYYVPDGMTVNFYESPESGKLIKTVDAGTRIYVGYSREIGGEIWGVGYPYGDWETEGWFRLGRLQLEFDNDAFMEEYRDQISAETVSFDCKDLTGPIPSWTYPGSGVPYGTLDLDWDQVTYNEGKLEVHQVYVDPNGGQWGYVGYYMGRIGWIYLDDLYAENPPTFPQEPENTVTDTSLTEETPASPLTWIYVLVAAVILLTAGCIVVLKRKRSV